MLILYHRSDDGLCSAAIAWWSEYARQTRERQERVELVPLDYGDPFDPLTQAMAGETCYLLDLSLPWPVMDALNERCALVWIDHHQRVIDEAVARHFDPAGLRDSNRASCRLTWDYFHRRDSEPWSVELLGRYDTWDISDAERWGSQVLPFQFGLRSRDLTPRCEMWAFLFDCGGTGNALVAKVTQNGHAILRAQRASNRRLVESAAFLLLAFSWQRDHWKVSVWLCCSAAEVPPNLRSVQSV